MALASSNSYALCDKVQNMALGIMPHHNPRKSIWFLFWFLPSFPVWSSTPCSVWWGLPFHQWHEWTSGNVLQSVAVGLIHPWMVVRNVDSVMVGDDILESAQRLELGTASVLLELHNCPWTECRRSVQSRSTGAGTVFCTRLCGACVRLGRQQASGQ